MGTRSSRISKLTEVPYTETGIWTSYIVDVHDIDSDCRTFIKKLIKFDMGWCRERCIVFDYIAAKIQTTDDQELIKALFTVQLFVAAPHWLDGFIMFKKRAEELSSAIIILRKHLPIVITTLINMDLDAMRSSMRS
jgi:hypothetical protein